MQITDYFTVFESAEACIGFRSRVVLSRPPYSGNAYIREAVEKRDSDLMAQGLKDAGWATSSSYVASLVSAMDAWSLRRFDHMTVEQWHQELEGGGVTGTGGQEYAAANEQQRRIADAARSTPATPGGWCAAWVTNVFARAGVGYVGGNACDMYWDWCTSSNKDELKVGMIVAVPSTEFSEDGRKYGHVGIYVGDGAVMHSTSGRVVTESLDSWIATYGTVSTPRWGFPAGVEAD